VAIIVDPDQLVQGTEVTLNTSTRKITLAVAGNMSADGVALQALYSFLKEEWKDDSSLIKHPFPMEPVTPEQYELKNGWDFVNDTSRNLVRNAGWAVLNSSGVITGMWAGVITLGSLETDDQVYYQQSVGGTATNVVRQGVVNQAVPIYSDPNGDGSTADGFDYRNTLNIFVREWQQTYAKATLQDIGVSAMTYQAYRFPLASSSDLKVTHTESVVNTTTPYTGINITYFESNQMRTIGAGSYPFRVIINGNNATAEQIYEKVQYSLRQNSDIDAGAGTVVGKTADDLLYFVGDTLKTRKGVYIDNFNTNDTNRLVFTDYNSVERIYPYVATLALNFGPNLVNDVNAIYRVFFTSGFGTASALLVNDKDSVAMSGSVGGSATVLRTFDYDANTQGGRTAGTDASITVVAIGLNNGQYVSATGTITRSTSNSVSLVASLERAYSNP
jgi:hypothetical protein